MTTRISIGVLGAIAWAATARGEIIDRIAVSVGNSAISTSDVEREIRVTAFLNGVKPDFSPASKKATADRMVEQRLIRHELELSHYPPPEPSAVEDEYTEFKQSHYKTEDELKRALAEAGVSEQEVRDELRWQMTLLRFIELRFRPGIQVSEQAIEGYFEKRVKPAAQAAHPGQSVSLDDYRDDIEEMLAEQLADKELDKWLAQTRQQIEIVYHGEAFQ